jgi:hypothetical protein
MYSLNLLIFRHYKVDDVARVGSTLVDIEVAEDDMLANTETVDKCNYLC